MGAGRRARTRAAKCEEWDMGLAEVLDEYPALLAVRMNGDVDGMAVVEPHTVMDDRLAARAHGQRPPEPGEEESLEAAHTHGRESDGALVPNDRGRGDGFHVGGLGHPRQLERRQRLADERIHLGHAPPRLLDFVAGG